MIRKRNLRWTVLFSLIDSSFFFDGQLFFSVDSSFFFGGQLFFLRWTVLFPRGPFFFVRRFFRRVITPGVKTNLNEEQKRFPFVWRLIFAFSPENRNSNRNNRRKKAGTSSDLPRLFYNDSILGDSPWSRVFVSRKEYHHEKKVLSVAEPSAGGNILIWRHGSGFSGEHGQRGNL